MNLDYNDKNTMLSILIRKIRSLAFLPPALVNKSFQLLMDVKYDDVCVEVGEEKGPFVDSVIEYFEAQWLRNEHISIHNWNVLSLDCYRTNNDSEAENLRSGIKIIQQLQVICLLS